MFSRLSDSQVEEALTTVQGDVSAYTKHDADDLEPTRDDDGLVVDPGNRYALGQLASYGTFDRIEPEPPPELIRGFADDLVQTRFANEYRSGQICE